MEKFTTLIGKAAYLPISNIDTDIIIPKQYLKTIKRTGLGKYLFADQRYDLKGTVIPDFILNKQPDTKILITGENFGCGSSREHAPWALLDFGIRAVISPSFADIFYNNCFKNGILPVKLPQNEIDNLLKGGLDNLSIDLMAQIISSNSVKCTFSIDPHRKEVLINGLDDIEKILTMKQAITDFEKQHFTKYPWLVGGSHA